MAKELTVIEILKLGFWNLKNAQEQASFQYFYDDGDLHM